MNVKDKFQSMGSVSQLWTYYEVDAKQLCSSSITKYNILMFSRLGDFCEIYNKYQSLGCELVSSMLLVKAGFFKIFFQYNYHIVTILFGNYYR